MAKVYYKEFKEICIYKVNLNCVVMQIPIKGASSIKAFITLKLYQSVNLSVANSYSLDPREICW